MAKKKLPTFAKKEEIPKGFEDLYEEVDGKFTPIEDSEDDDGEDEKEKEKKPGELQGALKKERERAEKAEKKSKELADSIAELKEKLETHDDEVEGKKHGKSGEEMKALRLKIRDDVRKEFAAEIEGLKLKITEMEPLGAENRTLRLNDRVKAAMLTAGARGERVDDLFRLAEQEFDLDDDKNPTLKNHPGKALKIFLEGDLKKRYPEFYKGTEAGGGGARGGNGGGGGGGKSTAEEIMSNPGAALTRSSRGGIEVSRGNGRNRIRDIQEQLAAKAIPMEVHRQDGTSEFDATTDGYAILCERARNSIRSLTRPGTVMTRHVAAIFTTGETKGNTVPMSSTISCPMDPELAGLMFYGGLMSLRQQSPAGFAALIRRLKENGLIEGGGQQDSLIIR